MAKLNVLLDEDELQVVEAYRRVRERKHGDLEISVVNGTLAKVWEVLKNDLKGDRLREVKV